MLRFSPADLKVYLRLLLAFLAWRLLSEDYTALAQLIQGPDLRPLNPPALAGVVDGIRPFLVGSETRILGLQIGGALLLLAGCITLRRGLALTGYLIALLIDLYAQHYRATTYEMSFVLAVLGIAVLWPAPWKRVLQGGPVPTAAATRLGLCMAAYCAGCYFTAGVAKLLAVPTWWDHVRLDLQYPSLRIVMGTVPSPWLDAIARWFHGLHEQTPRLGELAAFVTMCLEIAWPLALISRVARAVIPTAMLLVHVFVFLQTSLLFLSIAVVSYGSVFPWRRMLGRVGRGLRLAIPEIDSGGEATPASSPTRRRLGLVLSVSGAAALVAFPALRKVDYHPYNNFRNFGFSYGLMARPMTLHRIGYVDPATGQVGYVPPDYAGFVGRQFSVFANLPIAGVVRLTDPSAKQRFVELLQQYVRMLRPYRSYRRLLGPFACPQDFWSGNQPLPPGTYENLHMVRAVFDYPNRGLEATWEDLGPVPPLTDEASATSSCGGASP